MPILLGCLLEYTVPINRFYYGAYFSDLSEYGEVGQSVEQVKNLIQASLHKPVEGKIKTVTCRKN
ncbi:MAG: hypothetical protein ACQJCO_04675 [cyanobacterium endosymbiont of Rhopalodia sterrenbergii]